MAAPECMNDLRKSSRI